MSTHKEQVVNGRTVHTFFEFPPIPIRTFDFGAVLDGYEPGAPIGWGPTEEQAIADLFEQMDDE
jgi:hypothetical protein